MPPSSHFIYIPLVLVLGTVFGFIWGAKVTQESYRLEAMRTEERTKRKAARLASKEAAAKEVAANDAEKAVETPGKG